MQTESTGGNRVEPCMRAIDQPQEGCDAQQKWRKVGVSRGKIAFMAARFRRPGRAPESEDGGGARVSGDFLPKLGWV